VSIFESIAVALFILAIVFVVLFLLYACVRLFSVCINRLEISQRHKMDEVSKPQ